MKSWRLLEAPALALPLHDPSACVCVCSLRRCRLFIDGGGPRQKAEKLSGSCKRINPTQANHSQPRLNHRNWMGSMGYGAASHSSENVRGMPHPSRPHTAAASSSLLPATGRFLLSRAWTAVRHSRRSVLELHRRGASVADRQLHNSNQCGGSGMMRLSNAAPKPDGLTSDRREERWMGSKCAFHGSSHQYINGCGHQAMALSLPLVQPC